MQPCVAQFLIKYHTLCTLRQLCTLHDHLKLRLDNAGRWVQILMRHKLMRNLKKTVVDNRISRFQGVSWHFYWDVRIACPRIEAPFFNELTRVCRLFSEAGFVGPRQTAPFARIDQQRTCRVPVALRHVATHILETMRAIRRMGHEKCLGTRPSAQMKRHRRKWVTCSHTQHCFACGSKQR